jgi:hypothetical protein
LRYPIATRLLSHTRESKKPYETVGQRFKSVRRGFARSVDLVVIVLGSFCLGQAKSFVIDYRFAD